MARQYDTNFSFQLKDGHFGSWLTVPYNQTTGVFLFLTLHLLTTNLRWHWILL